MVLYCKYNLFNNSIMAIWSYIMSCYNVTTFLLVFLRVAVSLPSALYTVARGQSTIITCTGKGQPGLDISFYSNGSPVVISHIHELQTQVITDHNILGSTTRDLKINALGPQISASYTSCKLTNATTGYVRCERIYKCSA
eukprot:UN27730